MPIKPMEKPSLDFIRWHNERRFLACGVKEENFRVKPLKNEKKRPTEVSTPKISAGLGFAGTQGIFPVSAVKSGVSFKVSLKKEAKHDFFRG